MLKSMGSQRIRQDLETEHQSGKGWNAERSSNQETLEQPLEEILFKKATKQSWSSSSGNKAITTDGRWLLQSEHDSRNTVLLTQPQTEESHTPCHSLPKFCL